jgi:hypothetical protein
MPVIHTHKISVSLGRTPPRSAGPHRPSPSLLCQATPPRPATLQIHTCTISVLLGCAPQACQAPSNRHSWSPPGHALRPAQASTSPLGFTHHACTGLHNLRWDHALKHCQAGNPQTHRDSTLPAHALKAGQAHAPKSCYFSWKGLHLQTQPTYYSPQESSQPS